MTLTLAIVTAAALVAQSLAERGGPLPGPLPLFPADNWWNQDISQAPVDSRSAAIINFIGGAARGMHPDFGGIEDEGAHTIYGMPYVVVGADEPKVNVTFDYASESDHVGYPIPAQAITEPYWIEGGPAGNSGAGGDRHILIVDRDARRLYELFALRWVNGTWRAGSGAVFDLTSNARRPEGWTSADAAGLAILPGLVRYDEVFGPDEIRHAFRVTVNGVNDYVWPASHRANTNVNGPPLGTRLRLKAGTNISGYPAYIQKIFRAMKTHGLIVADTGSSMFVSGVFDTRWDNGQLNPAFRAIKAGDFEVVQLGWRGDSTPCTAPGAPTTLTSSVSGLSTSLSWMAPASGGAIGSYQLEAGSAPDRADLATVSLPSGTTSYAATAPPGTYYVRVKAQNACGSAVSNEVTVVLTTVCALPGAPGQPSATVNAPDVSVTWTSGSGATSHVFEAGLRPGAADLVNTVVAGNALAAQAPPGVYFVRARGRNACGTGPASPDRQIAVGCTAPGLTTLSGTVDGGTVSFDWTAATNSSSYVLEAGSAPGLSNIATLPVTGTSFVVNAPPGTYYVRLRPINACGSGFASNEVQLTVP
ncbi:MAG: fibronectin type III domain-containing protein [Acidobacteria bacterium]|nr:fibronectin type III domain-containing protein [Acidobacteriota bacterium]